MTHFYSGSFQLASATACRTAGQYALSLMAMARERAPANAYSAVFEKVLTSAHGGYISSPRRLRSTQQPPGRSMGVVDSGNAPGLNSRPSACGRSARGLAGGSVWAHSEGAPCGAREPAANPARPVALAVPRAPWASPPQPSPLLVGLRHLFGIFLLVHRGGTCA